MTEISIVIPVFNEEKNIYPLYSQLKIVLDQLNKSYEIIFVDDGSNDNSFNILKEIHNKDKNVRVIKFRKNFGQTSAISAGFRYSKGDIIITMDADLQNDPEDIPRLIEEINKGYDLVSGWRINRKDPFLTKKIPSMISNWLAKKLTGVTIHDFGCTFKAYRKKVLEGLDIYGEMHRYIPAIIAWGGFNIGEVEVRHHPRRYEKTKYGFWRLFTGFLDLMVVVFWKKYSKRPIHLFGSLGLLIGFVGFMLSIYLTLMKIIYNQSLTNRPLLLLGILLIIIGVQFIIFGLLADIMIRIYYKGEGTVYNIEEILEG